MKDWEDIGVNKRDSDEVRFESPLIQSIYDGIDFLRDETKNILEDLDSTEFKKNIDEFDIEEFGEETLNHFSDIADNLSQFRNEMIDSEDIPEFVKYSSRNAKVALNRDKDYVRRAKRRLNKLDSGVILDNPDKLNNRIIQLCDKAIDVNPKNYEAYYLKGRALINLEKYYSAIDEFISSLAINSDYPDARLGIANANRLNGDYEDAINVYDSVLNMDENSFDAFKGKAFTYFDWEKYADADNQFKKADSINELDNQSKEIWDVCLEKLNK